MTRVLLLLGSAVALAGWLPGASAVVSTSRALDGLLVFSCAGCPGAETGARLFTIRPDGTRLQILEGSEGVYELRWSPEGRSIAFTRGFRTISLALWRRS